MVEQSAARLDTVFHALSDPTRRAMLKSLAARDRTIGDLAGPFRISLNASSKHVKVLERAGLVRRTVRGRTHVCRLNAAPLAAADKWLRYYQRFWSERLDLLEDILRAEDAAAARQKENAKGKRHER